MSSMFWEYGMLLRSVCRCEHLFLILADFSRSCYVPIIACRTKVHAGRTLLSLEVKLPRREVEPLYLSPAQKSTWGQKWAELQFWDDSTVMLPPLVPSRRCRSPLIPWCSCLHRRRRLGCWTPCYLLTNFLTLHFRQGAKTFHPSAPFIQGWILSVPI